MKIFLSVILMSFFSVNCRAQETPDSILVPKLDTMILNNGLKVYFLQNKNVQGLNVRLVIKAGKRNENECEVGYSEVIQRLLSVIINEKQDEIFKKENPVACNIINGQTIISGDCLSHDLEKKMELFSSILSRLRFTKEKVDQIVSVISERYLPDNMSACELTNAFKNLLLYTKTNPLGRAYCQYQIQKVSPEKLREFYVTHYTPTISFLIVSGNFDLRTVKKIVAKHFIKWKTLGKNTEAHVEDNETKVPKIRTKEIALINKIDFQDYQLKWIWSAPSTRSADHAAFLLTSKLFDHFLFETLKQKKIEVSKLEPNSYTSDLMEFSCFGTQQNITAVIRNVDTIVQNFKTTQFSKTNLDEARTRLKGSYLKMNSAAMISSFYDPLAYDFNSRAKFLSYLSAINVNDIEKIQKEYFDPEAYKLVIVGKEHLVSDQLALLGNIKRYQTSDFETCDETCKEVIVIKCHCESCYRRGYCNIWRFDPKEKEGIKNAKARVKYSVK